MPIQIFSLTLIVGILATLYILALVVDKFLIPTIYLIKDKLKLSDDQTGVLTSFVSSAPELSVSLISLILAIRSNDAAKFSEIAALGPGAVIGSALFSVLFIVGASAWYSNKALTWHSVTRDMLYYIFAVGVLYLCLADKVVYWYEAVLLFGLYFVYAGIVSYWPKISKLLKIPGTTIPAQEIQESEAAAISLKDENWKLVNAIPKLISFVFFRLSHKLKTFPIVYNILMAVFLVVISSYFMVDFADKLAQSWGVPAVVIALTILAAGTSVPDLIASVKTARDGYGDTAITNAIGSNVFDVLGNLGLTWVIAAIFTAGRPIIIDTNNLTGSILLLIASSVVLILVLISTKFNLNKFVSALLMISYISYVIYICLQSIGYFR
jgi:K+-dependent Na+/Ca+ exchanger-like protein